jgi:hypothetical protein
MRSPMIVGEDPIFSQTHISLPPQVETQAPREHHCRGGPKALSAFSTTVSKTSLSLGTTPACQAMWRPRSKTLYTGFIYGPILEGCFLENGQHV